VNPKLGIMKNNRILHFTTLILFILISCNNEPIGIENNINSENVIKKNSELGNLIQKVVSENGEPLEKIVCIDFIYPFKVLIYDSTLEIIGNKVLIGDDQFSAFLEKLPASQSISISYPISTTLEDGTIFSINNNQELKIAIDSCSKEDIISYCNGLFGGCECETKCVWKVPYIENGDNKYASGVFETNGDGTLHFNFDDTNYKGTWTFLFFNNELHININLEGSSVVAKDWNIDRKIVLQASKIIIINDSKNTILNQSCETTSSYAIGDNGPAGGIVFYDKGEYSLGWRYMESALTDLDVFEWGCNGTSIQNSNSLEIGKGQFNTVKIVNFHDNLVNYYLNPSVCNILNNGSVAAQKAIINTQNDYKDWFLPSDEELKLMYKNLKINNIGNFTDSVYWSSTQLNANNVLTVDFSNGTETATSKIPTTNNIKTRAIRYF
jgi:hypothetical protein